ncbi:hypothetical protein Dimus_028042 [Dionaea muscipula]
MEEGEQLSAVPGGAAAGSGDAGAVEVLIDAGADVTYFDADGITPLIHAAKRNMPPSSSASSKPALCVWNALSPSNLSAGDLRHVKRSARSLRGHPRCSTNVQFDSMFK